jgi:N utilization substance protein B
MSRRRQARELILGCLYAIESAEQPPETVFTDQSARQSYDEGTVDYARRVFMAALKNRDRIDTLIKTRSAHWDFSRIGSVEKNILRAGIAELWYCPDTPAPVVINEAVELAKDYAGAESSRFVNGILDWVYKQGDGERPDNDQRPSTDNAPISSPEDRQETD